MKINGKYLSLYYTKERTKINYFSIPSVGNLTMPQAIKTWALLIEMLENKPLALLNVKK